MLLTKNLKLVPSDLKTLKAIMKDKQELGRIVAATVPASFPESPDALPFFYGMLKADPTLYEWLHFIIIRIEDNTVIGDCGFKGKPDKAGTAEIGYSIVPEYRGRGFATEGARTLVKYGFGHSAVRMIQAHSQSDNPGSIKVLEKVGMELVCKVEDPEEGEMFRWRLTRNQYLKAANPLSSRFPHFMQSIGANATAEDTWLIWF